MAKYLVLSTYMGDGAKSLLKTGGTQRKKAIDEAVRKLGGTLECFYWAFGDHDLVAIADIPDAVSAAALNLQVCATGVVKTKTIALLTAEQIDQAVKTSTGYRPPTG